MKYYLAPSILSSDLSKSGQTITELAQAGIEWIHFDVMDGQFVPPITFGSDFISCLPKIPGLSYEAHLMTLTPEAHFESFIKAGCTRIIFHAEATHHAYRLALKLRELGVSPGVAINPGTPVEQLIPLLNVIDLALIMTVNPGWGGQSFLPSCLSKISKIRELAPELEIQVDGGIDPNTLPVVKEAGANVFVVGSYLFKQSSVEVAISNLGSIL